MRKGYDGDNAVTHIPEEVCLCCNPIQAVSATTGSIVVRLRKQYRQARSACAPHCTIDMLANAFICPDKHIKRSSAATRIYMCILTCMLLPYGVHHLAAHIYIHVSGRHPDSNRSV